MSRYDELGRRSNDRPQPTRNQTQLLTPSKLQSQRARGHSGSGGGTLQRRTTLAVAPPPRISAGKTLHPEIEQVVALTLAHSSKIYCSGALARKIERQSDGNPAKAHEAGWSDVWAQLGGTTMSVWDMQAINKASQEGKEVPPSYLNVTDSVSQPTPTPNLRCPN
jgi:CCR4-NOT transcriptional complex subunit CAF120